MPQSQLPSRIPPVSFGEYSDVSAIIARYARSERMTLLQFTLKCFEEIRWDLIYDEDRARAIDLFKKSAEKGYDEAVQRLTELGLEVPPKKTRF